ncbi:alpha-tocopherol transfer protein-like [Mercenaria mercenaria]|uniref:alpha-tocopherol transfer protein-like n=1 Tax=Mercenaria mercenaria TaxID=6596 RepID=UPI001E1D92E6|nr:alpha-tocopherol transfer protein-like [Mercenaria mercenaria]XP_045191452.1 alpha-tocopherol transfer protein-like [Mercenaria mercenaria]XP_045191453.1 alpha-tocopherol transfer protein-like [Mercenaria mercenaria]
MSQDENYKCTLDDKSLQKAKRELNEDPKERVGALKALSDWVAQQKWLQSPTDARYLLGFLRARKFSQLGARELLENYWTVRTKYSDWYNGVSTSDNRIQDIIKQGVYIPLPGRDREGRKLVIVRLGAMDPKGKVNTFEDVMRANLALFDYILLDENIQVNGLVFVIDMTGFSRHHFVSTGMENTKKCMIVTQKALPGRIKELHYYNTGAVFESIFNMIRPMMSEKLRNRVHVHGQNLSSVYDKIDKCMLPEEYLPDDYTGANAGTIQEICNNLATELCKPDVKDFIQELHSGKYGVDLCLKPQDDLPQASFRKLNVS